MDSRLDELIHGENEIEGIEPDVVVALTPKALLQALREHQP